MDRSWRFKLQSRADGDGMNFERTPINTPMHLLFYDIYRIHFIEYSGYNLNNEVLIPYPRGQDDHG